VNVHVWAATTCCTELNDYILGLQHTWRLDAFRPLQPQDLNIDGQTQSFKRRTNSPRALNAGAKKEQKLKKPLKSIFLYSFIVNYMIIYTYN